MMREFVRRRGERRPPHATRSFNLVRWFLLLSFTSIALTSIASAVALSTFLERNILKRDAVVTMELVNSIIQAEGAAQRLIAGDPGERNELLDRLFAEIASLPEVIRANLYGRERTILWSSDAALIGAEFPTNPELDEVLAGEIVIEEGFAGEARKAEHAFLTKEYPRFFEIYLPVWGENGAQVIGAVEVYKAPERLDLTIERGNLLVWSIALAGGGVIYVALAWIILRAKRVIDEQQQRLADAHALTAVGEMASTVAHGLRNPLATIRTSAELALEESSMPPVREALHDIVSQSDRLEGWVHELLTSSRPESLKIEPHALDPLVLDCLQSFEKQLARSNVTLDLKISPGVRSVTFDPVALEQVINSLITNALDAMPTGGRLTVKLEEKKELALLSIADTGEGIPADQVEKVLRPFVTTKGTGVGVGLPLAKRIIERHRGTLRLMPAPEGGTLVEITMPLVD